MMINRLNKKEIGKSAVLLALFGNEQQHVQRMNEQLKHFSYQAVTGKVGSMDVQKVVAAIETTSKRSGIISELIYREEHALYHAIIEALHGITRGQLDLGDVLRTVGLRFAVVRGNPYENSEEGEWLAVALYGTIGAPVKGLEHEAIGLGINHL